MAKRHANENLRTSFKGSGRFAGTGIEEGDYSEESFPDRNPRRYKFESSFGGSPPKGKFKEPPVKTYRLSEEELKKYKKEGEHMAVPKLVEKKENGDHKYLCPKCELEIFVLREYDNCPRCGARFNWSKAKEGDE